MSTPISLLFNSCHDPCFALCHLVLSRQYLGAVQEAAHARFPWALWVFSSLCSLERSKTQCVQSGHAISLGIRDREQSLSIFTAQTQPESLQLKHKERETEEDSGVSAHRKEILWDITWRDVAYTGIASIVFKRSISRICWSR